MFKKATKTKSKLRLALCGPSGSGKTYTSLVFASVFGKVAVIDTERGSASKYADLFEFDVLELQPPYHPNRFMEAIADASDYDVLVIDSLSHAWAGEGGLLEEVEKIAMRTNAKNSYTAWRKGTPIQQKLIDKILNAPLHVIATMRSKQEYILEERQSGGRKTMAPRKVGMAPIQRNDIEFEFDVVGSMDLDNNLVIDKSRFSVISGEVYCKPDVSVGIMLRDWLSDGKEVVKDEPKKKSKKKKTETPKEEEADPLQPAIDKLKQEFGDDILPERVSKVADFFSDGASLKDLERYLGKTHNEWGNSEFDELTGLARQINHCDELKRTSTIRQLFNVKDREPGEEG